MSEHSHLLVPVALEALVVNRNDLATTIWSLTEKQYTEVSRMGAVDPPPFIRDNGAPEVGVTLHWALPDGLTRGRQVSGKLTFASVPNRWLVVRLAEETTEPATAWVIESDALDPVQGTNLYLDGVGQVTRLGRAFPLAEWLRDTTGAKPQSSVRRLTALGLHGDKDKLLGAADPAFAAYVPNVRNVFAFVDKLEPAQGGPKLKAQKLHYMVFGWYAPVSTTNDQSPHDPLHRQSHLGLKYTNKDRKGASADEWDSKNEWLQVLKELAWTAGSDIELKSAIPALPTTETDSARAFLPSRTLCHGMVYGVNWTGEHGAPQPVLHVPGSPFDTLAIDRPQVAAAPSPEAKRTNQPHIAIANSATDAFATLMEYLLKKEDTSSDFGKLFQALQTDLGSTFGDPGADIELQSRIRQNWFSSQRGGSWWEIVVEKAEGVSEKDNPPPEISDQQKKLLTDLNTAQLALDRAARGLEAAQLDLYTRWWKSKKLTQLATQPLSAGEIGVAESAARTLRASEAKAEGTKEVAAAKLAVEAEIVNEQGAKYKFRLIENEMPRYYRPADPTLLVYGCRASRKHGGDGRFHKDGLLECRLSGRSIQSLKAGDQSATAGQAVDKWFPEILAGTKQADVSRRLPAPIPNLLAELALLNPQWNLTPIAAFEKPSEIPKRQSMPWADPPAGSTITDMVTAAGFTGVWPSRVAVEPWSQPWTPLFLAWRLTWYPASRKPTVKPEWIFNGSDYDWTGLGNLDNSIAVVLQGRSILSAASTKAFSEGVFELLTPAVEAMIREQSRLSALINEKSDQRRDVNPAETAKIEALDDEIALHRRDLTKVEEELRSREAQRTRLSTEMASVDVLAQPLTGFHDKLIMRDPYQYYDPDPADLVDGHNIRKLVEGGPRLTPIPHTFANPEGLFNPIRAGHIRLDRVWVVDGFGQVFDPIQERGQSVSSFTPLRGTGLETAGLTQRTDTQALQLPPRISQPARLMFRFAASGSGGADSALDATVNPVCGWLLPNQLDDSLVVFDPNGNALGSIILFGVGSSKKLEWLEAAGSTAKISDPGTIGKRVNAHLGEMVNTLLGLPNAGSAFVDWMAAIDATLWTTEPLGKRGDNLSVLIGRPIAVTRVSLDIELAGPPATNQLWAKTNIGDTAGFTNTEFEVRLGHVNLRGDGTLGFFGPQGNSGATDYSKFFTVFADVDLQGTDKYVQKGTLPAKINQKVFATVLLDPRGVTHASTGILPTKAIQLPAKYVTAALASMDVTFRIGPILTEPKSLRMPLPVNVTGSWAWIERTGVTFAPADPDVKPASTEAHLPDESLHIREGWLQLSDAVGNKI